MNWPLVTLFLAPAQPKSIHLCTTIRCSNVPDSIRKYAFLFQLSQHNLSYCVTDRGTYSLKGRSGELGLASSHTKIIQITSHLMYKYPGIRNSPLQGLWWGHPPLPMHTYRHTMNTITHMIEFRIKHLNFWELIMLNDIAGYFFLAPGRTSNVVPLKNR